MKLNRAHSKLLAAITAWVMAFAALAPSVSHALMMQKAKDGSWLEVCTAQGSKWIKVNKQFDPPGSINLNSDTSKSADVHIQHGKCCVADLPAATLPVLPPALVQASLSATEPTLFYRAPRPLFIWAAIQARAPPRA
ncbi:DUF2946 family protein [Parvibium lacunae]|nr:DUF2946 family protein [Parvibium lacunae]